MNRQKKLISATSQNLNKICIRDQLEKEEKRGFNKKKRGIFLDLKTEQQTAVLRFTDY